MGYPEIILLVWIAIDLGLILHRHGETVQMTWWDWEDLAEPSLLAWGGFFSALGAPQVIYIIWSILTTGFAYLNRDNFSDYRYNFYASVPVAAMYLGLYWWGGFFS